MARTNPSTFCVTTSSSVIGSTCSVNTTLNAMIGGLVKSGKRSVMNIFRVRVNDAGPDNALYPMKRFGESVLVTLEVDPVNRAGLEVKLAQTREREAEDMAGRGNGDGAVAALASRYELMRTASRDLIGVPVRDARWKSVRGRLFTESDLPITQIQRDLQVSGQKRSSA